MFRLIYLNIYKSVIIILFSMGHQTLIFRYGLTHPIFKNYMRSNKMPTIREEANSYETKKTKNISELKQVNVNVNIEDRTFTKEDGEEFTIKIATIDEQEYRVPVSVLKSLKVLIAEKPGMTLFKVVKSGSGMDTEYNVIPLD